MATGDYLDVDYLRLVLRTPDSVDELLQLAISAASAQIDEYTNDQFWTDESPSPRMFQADHPRRLLVPSFASVTGLLVEVDLDDDGTYETTWTRGVHYQAAPTAPMPGCPYREIQTLSGAHFPGTFYERLWSSFEYGTAYGTSCWGGEWYPTSLRPRVRVTAQWGWPEVPPQVRQACQILAVDHYKSKDFTNGSAGTAGLTVSGPFGKLVSPTRMGINPLAASLLTALREPVIA